MVMEEKKVLLRKTGLFGALSDDDIVRVSELLDERSYHRGSTIYRQGELDTNFYIVVSGQLRVWIRDDRGRERTLNYLQPGDSFGEHSLLTGERRDVNVEAEEAAVLLSLAKRDFEVLLESYPHLRKALGLHKLVRLRNASLLKKLSVEDIQRIAALMGRTRYRQGSTILRHGELTHSFYIIDSGKVALLSKRGAEQDRIFTYLEQGGFFGEQSLLSGEPTDTTVQAVEDTTLFYLSKRDFDRLLTEHPSIRQTLKTEGQAIETTLTRRFPWQREGELLLVLSRKHIYAFIRSLWLLIFPLLALGGSLALALTFDWTDIPFYIVGTLTGLSGLALVAWLFVDWRNDYYAVTNKRVVHVEKVLFFRESREEAPLERIQDIFILMPGLTARLLHFNDLSIQTAGATGRIVFKTIGNAAWVRDKVFEQLERSRAEERAEEREDIRRKLKLELGEVQEDQLLPAEQEQVSSVAVGTQSLPAHLLHRMRNYLVPEMRVEEHGVVTWRKHWFRLVDRIAGPLLLLLVLLQLGVAALIGLLAPVARFADFFWTALLIGVPVGLFLLWYRYEDWRNDVYQLTDDRIIDLERLPLGLREERREASLAMIQDIGYEIPGIIANLFDYGNVVIETAGREAVFTFDWVHRPRRVQEEVFARMDAFQERERQRRGERRAHELLDWFATYAELKEEQTDPELEENGE